MWQKATHTMHKKASLAQTPFSLEGVPVDLMLVPRPRPDLGKKLAARR